MGVDLSGNVNRRWGFSSATCQGTNLLPPPFPSKQGNPSVNDAQDFVPVLRQAKEMGLSLAIHLAEIDRPEDTAALMALPPDRIGVVAVLK